jgi:8-amino-7-oxononanoate synthase
MESPRTDDATETSAPPLIDLTRFSYLGLLHASAELGGWERLSPGLPPALDPELGHSAALERELAALVGCDAACLGRSTLHLFRDLFDALGREPCAFIVDESTYAIARWGLVWAQAAGAPVTFFAAHDVAALDAALDALAGSGRRPVVVTDGISGKTWSPAPLRDYAERVAAHEGLLIVDDTHAVGVFGGGASTPEPFGRGGGGSLAWHALGGEQVLLVSSLGKGFGVPLAALAGSAARVDWFRARSSTRVHCSGPTAPELRALEHALHENAERGDALRATLLRNIAVWRSVFHDLGFATNDPFHPVQRLRLPRGTDLEDLPRAARARGVRVWVSASEPMPASVLVVLTAALSETEVASACGALASALEEVTSYGRW